MISSEFVIWLKGFTEACNDFTPTPKQWDRIKEVLNEVQDYNDNPGLDTEIDDWYLGSTRTIYTQGDTITFTSGSSNTSITNLPNGTNVTYTNKHQLND